MFKHRRPLQDRVDDLKGPPEYHYYALSLRSDLVVLLEKGLERSGMTQRDLSSKTGMWESVISRLANAMTNFEIGVVPKVLMPLGIRPMIVDKAEYDKLRAAAERVEGGTVHIQDQATPHVRTDHYSLGTSPHTITVRADSAGAVGSDSGQPRATDSVGGARPMHGSDVGRRSEPRYPFVLSNVRRTLGRRGGQRDFARGDATISCDQDD